MEEREITRAIIESYSAEWVDNLRVDVCIAGAGPAGMLVAKRVAEAGLKTIVVERKLALGGGIWGGGMMLNKVVLQPEAVPILEELSVRHQEHSPGYHVVDAVELTAGLALAACQAGAKIFNLMSVDDVMVRGERVCGTVVNWTAVNLANLHIDPLTFECRAVVDATGHPAEVTKLAAEKSRLTLADDVDLNLREKSMWAENAEQQVVEMTGSVCPGLYVVGMAACAARGGYRMGPIFGGMLLSAAKLADLLIEELGSNSADDGE